MLIQKAIERALFWVERKFVIPNHHDDTDQDKELLQACYDSIADARLCLESENITISTFCLRRVENELLKRIK